MHYANRLTHLYAYYCIHHVNLWHYTLFGANRRSIYWASKSSNVGSSLKKLVQYTQEDVKLSSEIISFDDDDDDDDDDDVLYCIE